MAIDSVTLTAAVKAAAKVLTDEGTRKKVLVIAVAPLAAFILIISLFFYILTLPLKWLGDLFGGNDYDTVVELRADHGYDQYIDATDEDCPLPSSIVKALTVPRLVQRVGHRLHDTVAG